MILFVGDNTGILFIDFIKKAVSIVKSKFLEEDLILNIIINFVLRR